MDAFLPVSFCADADHSDGELQSVRGSGSSFWGFLQGFHGLGFRIYDLGVHGSGIKGLGFGVPLKGSFRVPLRPALEKGSCKGSFKGSSMDS